ncbi:MAG: hypothetical protein Q7I94_03720 [Candidatus Contubernalis sp.]|nr:hypothetical protein [Candidatus Contubernalis sp.]
MMWDHNAKVERVSQALNPNTPPTRHTCMRVRMVMAEHGTGRPVWEREGRLSST